MLKNYIMLYSNKKAEDLLVMKSLFSNTFEISIVWTDYDYNKATELIDSQLLNKDIKQIIFFGFELGWDRLVEYINSKYKGIKVKVISNTTDALIYYDYERNNFFKLLELNKRKLVKRIGTFKIGTFESYSKIGYDFSYLCQKIDFDFSSFNEKNKTIIEEIKNKKEQTNKINIGMYPLNYVWDKNIFNQLSTAKFIDNSVLNYNKLSDRMQDFLETMGIESVQAEISQIELESITKEIIKNDIIVSCSFTEIYHPITLLSLELGIPCITGNNSDLFSGKLKDYLVVDSEDNPIKVSEKIKLCLENKQEILNLYKEWKTNNNESVRTHLNEFLNN